MENFYDRVAKEFGGYAYSSSNPKYESIYLNGNPEEIFKEKLLELAAPSSVALDIGCGDGKFSFEIAEHFSKIIGLDSSKELITIANKKMSLLDVKNMSFRVGDAKNTPYESNLFDIIFNRRGPSFYSEYARLLKPGGHYFEIGIGEQDAMELKKTFGRGQNFGEWVTPRLKTDSLMFKALGLKPIYLNDFMYSENYLSKEDFELFLRGVPIFEDFSINKDQNHLDEYYKKNYITGQVKLDRHRVVYVLEKQV